MKVRIDLDNLPEDKAALLEMLADAKARIEECDKRISEGDSVEYNNRRRAFYLRLRSRVLIKLRPPEAIAKAVAAKAAAIAKRSEALVEREKMLLARRSIANQNLMMQKELQENSAKIKAQTKAENIARSERECREKSVAAYNFVKERAPQLLPDLLKVFQEIEKSLRQAKGGAA